MLASERKALRRARTYLAAGDRAAALKLIRELEAPPPRPPPPAEQLTITVVVAAVPFYCDRLAGTMLLGECLERRGETWPSGGRRGIPKRRECLGCPVGAGNALACPGIELRAPQQAPDVLPAIQRMAKRARDLVGLGFDDVVAMDPMREAASLSPDDKDEWRST